MHAKQYIALARAIKENTRTNEHNEIVYPLLLWGTDFINALCDILAADNKNFDKSKFLEACK